MKTAKNISKTEVDSFGKFSRKVLGSVVVCDFSIWLHISDLRDIILLASNVIYLIAAANQIRKSKLTPHVRNSIYMQRSCKMQ